VIPCKSTGELTGRYRDILGQYDRTILHADEGAARRLAEVSDALIETARELIRQLGRGHVAVSPVTVWWRDGFTSGRRGWVTDEKHGRAGIWYQEIVEAAS
jgi:hypothetical protein